MERTVSRKQAILINSARMTAPDWLLSVVSGCLGGDRAVVAARTATGVDHRLRGRWNWAAASGASGRRAAIAENLIERVEPSTGVDDSSGVDPGVQDFRLSHLRYGLPRRHGQHVGGVIHMGALEYAQSLFYEAEDGIAVKAAKPNGYKIGLLFAHRAEPSTQDALVTCRCMADHPL
jgi:hypothetical protein